MDTMGDGAVFTMSVLRSPTVNMASGRQMVGAVHEGVAGRRINKVSLIAFTKNDVGNAFWNRIGWTKREDLNYYDFTLNEENITVFIE